MKGITVTINPSSGQPLYDQITKQIRSQVLQGTLKDGDQLPSIRALARDLQVSIITTKRAYEELEREGLLTVSAGRGTFVSAKGIEHSRQGQLQELEGQLLAAAVQARHLGLGGEAFTRLAQEQYNRSDRSP